MNKDSISKYCTPIGNLTAACNCFTIYTITIRSDHGHIIPTIIAGRARISINSPCALRESLHNVWPLEDTLGFLSYLPGCFCRQHSSLKLAVHVDTDSGTHGMYNAAAADVRCGVLAPPERCHIRSAFSISSQRAHNHGRRCAGRLEHPCGRAAVVIVDAFGARGEANHNSPGLAETSAQLALSLQFGARNRSHRERQNKREHFARHCRWRKHTTPFGFLFLAPVW